MSATTQSSEEAYEELANLTGKHIELTKRDLSYLKAIRALRDLIPFTQDERTGWNPDKGAYQYAIEVMQARRADISVAINNLASAMDRINGLIQNGAFNHE